MSATFNNKNLFIYLKGSKGDKGATGAKLVNLELQGQDENGGNIYLMTFDDGTTATFTAPKGQQGEAGQGGGSSLDVQIDGISIVENGVANIPFDTKLDKTTESGYRLYRSANGNNSTIAYGEGAVSSTIPIRGSNKNFKVGDPKEDLDCVNLQTLNNALANAGGTQLYKHELIINKTDTDYAELIFISTQSTAFTSVQDALDNIFNSGLESLVKGFTYIWVDYEEESFYKIDNYYVDFRYSPYTPPFNYCMCLSGGAAEEKFTDISNVFLPNGTIEEYAPIAL